MKTHLKTFKKISEVELKINKVIPEFDFVIKMLNNGFIIKMKNELKYAESKSIIKPIELLIIIFSFLLLFPLYILKKRFIYLFFNNLKKITRKKENQKKIEIINKYKKEIILYNKIIAGSNLLDLDTEIINFVFNKNINEEINKYINKNIIEMHELYEKDNKKFIEYLNLYIEINKKHTKGSIYFISLLEKYNKNIKDNIEVKNNVIDISTRF